MTAINVAVAALSTAVLTLALTWPLARRLAALGLVDEPNYRSMHTGTIPRGGGAGIVVATTVVTIAAIGLGLDGRAIVTLGASLGLSAVGFFDDRYNLAATPRLLAQLLVAAVAIMMINDDALNTMRTWPLLPAALIATVWVVGCCNAVNFMDGIAAITGLHMIVFGIHLLIVGYDDELVRVPAALLVGSAVGFLYWSAYRNKVFLGDGGAYFIGASYALLVVVCSIRTTPPLVAAAPFAVYAADTATAFTRRVARGEKLNEGHREHVYQRLVLQGRRHLPIAGFTALCSATCGAAAIAVDRGILDVAAGVALVIAVLTLYLTAPRWMPRGLGSERRFRRRAEGTSAR